MIMTQNPKGANSDFYQVFEKPKLINNAQILMIEKIRDKFKLAFSNVEKKLLLIETKKEARLKKILLKAKGKSSYKFLSVGRPSVVKSVATRYKL